MNRSSYAIVTVFFVLCLQSAGGVADDDGGLARFVDVRKRVFNPYSSPIEHILYIFSTAILFRKSAVETLISGQETASTPN